MDINGDTIIDRYIREENRLVTNNPLGHKSIKDIDEVMCRNRRKTDDPYIKLLRKKEAEKEESDRYKKIRKKLLDSFWS